MNVLIVFEVIPEETIIAKVEMSNDEYELFSNAHNYTINASKYDEKKSDAVNLISNALCNEKDNVKYCNTDMERKYFGCFSKNITDGQDICGCERLIHCGCYMQQNKEQNK